jgi:hypothetical protein
MARFRVYIKPFDDNGDYQDDWIEVTDDLESGGVSSIKQALDNTEYDVGVFRNSDVTLNLNNLTGRYSDVGQPNSIFKFRRANSMVKIAWDPNDHDLVAGFFLSGTVYLYEDEFVLFEGVLDDTALRQNADDQNLKFKVLGKEFLFSETIVPFDSISNGDLFSEIIYTMLNQAAITDLLTIDQANISCDVDLEIDDKTELQNKTVREALGMILQYSNSVLRIENNTVYVSGREPSADVEATFYGQGSRAGMENIIDIQDFRIGLNRVFNFLTWEDTTLVSQDETSIRHNGYQKKEISTDLITDNTKRQTILDAIKDEFKNAKRELMIRVPLEISTHDLTLLDKIQVDYPNVGMAAELAVWDDAVWDEAVFPYEILPIAIEDSARFKIIAKEIDPTNQELVLSLREV